MIFKRKKKELRAKIRPLTAEELAACTAALVNLKAALAKRRPVTELEGTELEHFDELIGAIDTSLEAVRNPEDVVMIKVPNTEA